jgi:hypothetical protein
MVATVVATRKNSLWEHEATLVLGRRSSKGGGGGAEQEQEQEQEKFPKGEQS